MRRAWERLSHTQQRAQRLGVVYHVDLDVGRGRDDGLLLGSVAIFGVSLALLVAHVGGAGAVWKGVSRHVEKFNVESAECGGGEKPSASRATGVAASADAMTYA